MVEDTLKTAKATAQKQTSLLLGKKVLEMKCHERRRSSLDGISTQDGANSSSHDNAPPISLEMQPLEPCGRAAMAGNCATEFQLSAEHTMNKRKM
jgi:hypothetical protein